jgi:predicted DNA-binding transcriptional regulator YafY
MHDTDLNKSQKFVKLLDMVRRRGGVHAEELMERFELDARTLRRYLADLRDSGVPLRDETANGKRVISVEASYARAGVQLTLMEVLSLHFGRTLFTFLEGTSFANDLDDALARLQPAIGRADADLVKHIDRKFMAVAEHAKDYSADGGMLDEIISAVLHSCPADAEYASARGRLGKLYRLEPLTLAVYRQGLYLFARDVAEDRVKIFAVERFVRFSHLRRERFEYPLDYDPRARIADAFGIIAGEPEEIVARFTPDVATYVRERAWHASQRVEVLGDGGVRLTLRVFPGPELREWLLGFGASVVVEAPVALASEIRDAHLAAAARYA